MKRLFFLLLCILQSACTYPAEFATRFESEIELSDTIINDEILTPLTETIIDVLEKENNITVQQQENHDYIERIPEFEYDKTMPRPFRKLRNGEESISEEECLMFYSIINNYLNIPCILQDDIGLDIVTDWFKKFEVRDGYLDMFADITRFSQFSNLYSFILYFEVDEDRFRKAVREQIDIDEKQGYGNFLGWTDEHIEVLLRKDEEKIVKTFINEYGVINGVHFYTPCWVYYNTIDTYKSEKIPPESLVNMLDKYKEITFLSDEAYKALEEKILKYADDR